MKHVHALLILFIIFCGPQIYSQDNYPEKIRFAAHWMPQAQFAGYYIGVEKGIYKKYGLEVEVLHANPNETSQDLLLDGKADYASMFLSTAISLRSYGYPIVNVFQLSQKCAQVLISRKTKNIIEPADYNGKRIGVWKSGFTEVNSAFINKFNIDVEIVPISSTINLFLSGGIDVMLTMWYNEYHSIINSGLNEDELNKLFFSDYGLNVLEDGIYCRQATFDKVITQKFIDATVEAWEYAFAHPEESIDIVILKMNEHFVPANRAHQNWMFHRMRDLFTDGNTGHLIGTLQKDDFINAMEILEKQGKVKKSFSYEEFYSGKQQ